MNEKEPLTMTSSFNSQGLCCQAVALPVALGEQPVHRSKLVAPLGNWGYKQALTLANTCACCSSGLCSKGEN